MPETTQASEPVEPQPTTGHSAPDRRKRLVRLALVGLLITAAGIYVWDQFIKYRLIAKRWGVVVPKVVYRSGQVSKWVLEDKLKEHDIEVIVDLNGLNPDNIHQRSEIETAERMGIDLHRLQLHGDGSGDIRKYAKAIRIIAECEREGRPILVHCAAGAQRTGGVVAAYRVLVRGDPPQMAYAELSRYGWQAHEDQKLLTYVNGHMAELAQMLAEMGVIDRVPDPLPYIGP